MTPSEPISVWIDGLREGDESAAKKIWQHFVGRLREATRPTINHATRRVYDEEDAAQSAFRSLFGGMSEGRFPDLKDREGLWRLLLVITSRKISHRHRFDHQQCRDVRKNIEESVFRLAADSGHRRLEQFASREPTPEFQAEFMDVSVSLFDCLKDPVLQQISRLKIQGFGDSEVAEQLNCSRQSIQRKVERIRRSWSDFQKSSDCSQPERPEVANTDIDQRVADGNEDQ